MSARGVDSTQKMIREFRARFRRDRLYIEKRDKKSDRRSAFFSFVQDDRRTGERRKFNW